MNRKLIWSILALVALAVGGCHTNKDNDGQCHIYGVANELFEGKKIFLVPLVGPATADRVDSVVISEGKFRFTTAPGDMKVIRIDYHYRINVQDLLVVAEPGRVDVVIDTVSSGGGTPQNDSLQQWKAHTEEHQKQVIILRKAMKQAKAEGNQTRAEELKAQLDTLQRNYRRYSRAMASRLEEGTLKEFLSKQFPTTIKRRMADGTVEEVPYD